MEKSAFEEQQPKEVVGKEEDMMELAEERKKPRRKGWLRERKVRELVQGKRRLVEVSYNATLAHTLNVLIANRIAAVPVAAPPGHWIGTGGFMNLESNKATGVVRKHYIGMVTMLDILAHIAEEDNAADFAAAPDLDVRMAVPVSSIIDMQDPRPLPSSLPQAVGVRRPMALSAAEG